MKKWAESFHDWFFSDTVEEAVSIGWVVMIVLFLLEVFLKWPV